MRSGRTCQSVEKRRGRSAARAALPVHEQRKRHRSQGLRGTWYIQEVHTTSLPKGTSRRSQGENSTSSHEQLPSRHQYSFGTESDCVSDSCSTVDYSDNEPDYLLTTLDDFQTAMKTEKTYVPKSCKAKNKVT